MPLSLRQEQFINAYLGEANGNATQAARLAGYKGSDHALQVAGNRLLSNAEIRTRADEHRKMLGITRERILLRLMAIADDDRPNNGIAAVKALQLVGAEEKGMFKPVAQERDNEWRIVVVREALAQPDRLMIATNTTTSNRHNQTDNTIVNQEEDNNIKEKEKEEDR